MKVKVNQDKCFGCGACVGLVNEVFDFNDEGLAHVVVDKVPQNKEKEVIDAIKNCPAEAIYEEK